MKVIIYHVMLGIAKDTESFQQKIRSEIIKADSLSR